MSEETALRVALVVPGRFQAFDLLRGLLDNGHDASLFTNYPPRAAARAGVPAERVHTLPRHRLATRMTRRVSGVRAEAWLATWFGRWTARQLATRPWDLILLWNGAARDWVDAEGASACRNALVRPLVHVRWQRQLLEEEEQRVGVELPKPSEFAVERELHEYQRVQRILVPSQFARNTFLQQAVPAERLATVPVAAPDIVRAEPQVLQERMDRLDRREPLRILFLGTICYRKGLHDLMQVIEALPARRFQFRLAGALAPECVPVERRLAGRAELPGRADPEQLQEHLAWADLLVLPSIVDGYALALVHAAAAGLPFVASTHTSGPDLVEAGAPGWIMEPRMPRLLSELLQQLDEDRDELKRRLQPMQDAAPARTWPEVAGAVVSAARA